MYATVPALARAWRTLFERVFGDTKQRIDVMEHRWPEPIDEL